jgi:hypothetical protein
MDDKETTGGEEIDTFNMMEEIVEKLKILDYEANFTRIK